MTLTTKNLATALVGVGLVLALAFAFATPASAAVNLQDFGFKINSNTSDTIKAGDSFGITFNGDVNGGDEVEFFRVRGYNTNGDIVFNQCQPMGRVIDANDKDFKFDVDTPGDLPEGAVKIGILPFGVAGEVQSNGCDLANDIGSEKQYSGRLFVDNDGSFGGNDNSSSVVGSVSWFQAQIAALMQQIADLKKEKENNKPACPPVGSTETVQTWLLNNGYAAGFHAAGVYSATGYWGPITAAAHASAMAACK